MEEHQERLRDVRDEQHSARSPKNQPNLSQEADKQLVQVEAKLQSMLDEFVEVGICCICYFLIKRVF